MKPLLALALVAAATPTNFHYQRTLPAIAASGESCAVLDDAVFSHAQPSLADLRIFRNGAELPYRLQQSVDMRSTDVAVPLLNLGQQAGQIVFDAEMPPTSYSDVELNLRAQDFVASVEVRSSQSIDGIQTLVGSYNIYDLTTQHLGRGTRLSLPLVQARYLHFRIRGPLKPEVLDSLIVPGSLRSEARFQTVALATTPSHEGTSSVYRFVVPAGVPVEQLSVQPSGADFSRTVRILVRKPADQAPIELAGGEIAQVHQSRNGVSIDRDQRTLPLYTEVFPVPTTWTVQIENGNDRPVELAAVRLERRERTICYPAGAATLLYGDPEAKAPVYDYASIHTNSASATIAVPGNEQTVPGWKPPADRRPLSERFPVLLWLVLGAVIALLGWTTWRTAQGALRDPVHPS